MSNVVNVGLKAYCPEMGEKKPIAQIEATMSYSGAGHWFLDTPLELKGQGIKFLKKYKEDDFIKSSYYKVGWNSYKVTGKAFDKLKKIYAISKESLLD
jgi:hypothetical protein